jgi:hypothetical protein
MRILFCFLIFCGCAHASQEGILSISSFQISSPGIGTSGPVTVLGQRSEIGKFKTVTVEAFKKKIQIPNDLLADIVATNTNGIQISFENGYAQLGGRTVYVTFQKGFTSGIQSQTTLAVYESGKAEVLSPSVGNK